MNLQFNLEDKQQVKSYNLLEEINNQDESFSFFGYRNFQQSRSDLQQENQVAEIKENGQEVEEEKGEGEGLIQQELHQDTQNDIFTFQTIDTNNQADIISDSRNKPVNKNKIEKNCFRFIQPYIMRKNYNEYLSEFVKYEIDKTEYYNFCNQYFIKGQITKKAFKKVNLIKSTNQYYKESSFLRNLILENFPEIIRMAFKKENCNNEDEKQIQIKWLFNNFLKDCISTYYDI